MEQIHTQIVPLMQELDRLKRNPSRIEEEIKNLHDKILEVGGDKLQAQKSKVDQIKKQIVIANEWITESQAAKLKMERDITKLEDSLSEGKSKLQELDNEIQQFKKAIEQKEITICSIRATFDETKTVFIQININSVILTINLLLINFLYLGIGKEKREFG